MKKKQLEKVSLYGLIQKVQCTSRHGDPGECVTRLRHALLTHRLWQLYGTKFVYGPWMRLDDFLTDVPSSFAPQMAPLCVFVSDHENRLWSPAAVFRCAGRSADSTNDASMAEVLRAAGVGYLSIPAGWFENGLLTTPAFKQVVDEVIFNAASADPESFLSAPRPIYPPRSGVLRD